MKKRQRKKQYKKEIKRIEGLKNELESKGYATSNIELPELNHDKIYVSDIKKLKSIKSDDIIKDSLDLLDEKQRKSYDKMKVTLPQEKPQMPLQVDIVISNYLKSLKQFPKMAEPVLSSWINELIQSEGKERVAIMLQEGMDRGVMIDWQSAYTQDGLMNHISDMLEFLPEIGEYTKETFVGLFENLEVWNDYK